MDSPEVSCGEVSEWSKEHAWKVCIRQRIEGSNPSLTANQQKGYIWGILQSGPVGSTCYDTRVLLYWSKWNGE